MFEYNEKWRYITSC